MPDRPETTGAALAAPSPRPSLAPFADPVGLLEIADRLGVKPQTARMWRVRHVMPAPRWTVSGQPAWDWPDVEDWAWATGRILPAEDEPTD